MPPTDSSAPPAAAYDRRSFMHYFAGLAGQTHGATTPTGADTVSFTQREPYGVVVRIVPFNHPFKFAAGKCAAPLAAGNAVVLKPGEQTSLSALELARTAAEVLPPGVLNVVTGRGRHTSTSAISLELPFGGWIIDTPGIRSFGLAHVQVDDLIKAFPDLQDVTRDCPRGCLHSATEPECALDIAVADGTLATERVESFRRILTSMNQRDDY